MAQQSALEYIRSGQTPFFRLPCADPRALKDVDAALIGVTFDVGTTYQPGARLAPYHLRRVSALVQSVHPVHRVDVFDHVRAVDAGSLAERADQGPAPHLILRDWKRRMRRHDDQRVEIAHVVGDEQRWLVGAGSALVDVDSVNLEKEPRHLLQYQGTGTRPWYLLQRSQESEPGSQLQCGRGGPPDPPQPQQRLHATSAILSSGSRPSRSIRPRSASKADLSIRDTMRSSPGS